MTMALARDLVALAEQSGDPAHIAIACRALGYSLFLAGKQAEADPVLARSIALSDGLADSRFAVYAENPRIICRLYRAQVRCFRGYPETGLQIAGEGVAMACACNNPYTIAWSLVVLADIHMCFRNSAWAERTGTEAIDVARQHRFVQWLALAQQWRGWALCQLGDVAQGLALLEEGRSHLHATGAMVHTTRVYCYLAHGCLLAGKPEAALGHIEAAHRHADTYGEHYLSAEIHRLHAEVLQIQGAPASEIEGHLHAALNIARQQGARLYELRAATSLARLWHAQGRGAEANALLGPLYASFTEGFDLPDLVEARILLSQTKTSP